jgi:hypothetical protein
MPDPDPSAPAPTTPAPTTPGSPKILHLDFANDTWWFSSEFAAWSPSNVASVRLFDSFRFTPPTDADKLKVAAGMTVLNVIWAKKGPIWMSTLLDLDANYETDKGATGTVKLNTGLMYQPIKAMRVELGVTLTGQWNSQTGFDGSVQLFNSSIQYVDQKSMWGAALHYSF